MRALAVLILVTTLFLAGCPAIGTTTTAVDALRAEIKDRGAALEDQLRDDAEFVTCYGMSIGAWRRKYGANAKLAAAWQAICGTSIEQLPAPQPPK